MLGTEFLLQNLIFCIGDISIDHKEHFQVEFPLVELIFSFHLWKEMIKVIIIVPRVFFMLKMLPVIYTLAV